MDTDKQSVVMPWKSRLARAIPKAPRKKAVTGIAPINGLQRSQSLENVNDDGVPKVGIRSFDKEDECDQGGLAFEALVSRLFASISAIKAAYARIQLGESPYDADEIQAADMMAVSEFKNLSELKLFYLNKQFDPAPEKAILSAEVQEHKSILRTFEITRKRLESQLRLKDSAIKVLAQQMEKVNKYNKSIEKKINQSGQLSALDQLHLSGLSPNHFDTLLRHTIKFIRSFVRFMINEMKAVGWDIDAVASSIETDVVYWKADHKCFAFESFICREMFAAFHHPNFLLPNESLPENDKKRQVFFQRFTELKSVKVIDYLSRNPRSTFAKFCRAKYLALVHPRIEASLLGNLCQRNIANFEEFPDTALFASFVEMAKWVWLLHCLAFSFEPEVSIFQVRKGCRFSEVYMESVTLHEEDKLLQFDPYVALSVVPGFRIGKTVIQCQVYLSVHPC